MKSILKHCIKSFIGIIIVANLYAHANPQQWQVEWPQTDFNKSLIDFAEVIAGGPPKDGIPAIDNPKFQVISKAQHIGDREPVMVLQVQQQVKVYPLQILIWHEIVNDHIANLPITVTYCPLCNAAIVF